MHVSSSFFRLRVDLSLTKDDFFLERLPTPSSYILLPFLFVIRAGLVEPKNESAPSCKIGRRCPLTPSVGRQAGQPASQPATGPSGSAMVSNGECSQLGSHGSYMNACMRPETPAIGPMSAAVAYRSPLGYDRYVGDIHDDRDADR